MQHQKHAKQSFLVNEQSVSDLSKQGITPQTAQINSDSSPFRKNTQISLDSKIWDNSYTLIYQAQQELLSDKLDEILKNHKGNRVQDSFRTNQQKNSIKEISLGDCRQSLQNNLKSQQNSIEQLSILGNDFFAVEGLIQEYRHHLELYQQKIQKQFANKNKQVDFWKNQCAKISDRTQKDLVTLKERNFQLQKQLVELQYENKIIKERFQMTRKQGLVNSKSKKVLRNFLDQQTEQLMNLPDWQFNQTVQRQMEALVGVLSSQLYNQKKSGATMKVQILRLQKELIVSQKTIMQKNQAIHQLHIKLLNLQKSQVRKDFSIQKAKITLTQGDSQQYSQISEQNYHLNQTDQIVLHQPKFTSREIKPTINFTREDHHRMQQSMSLAELLQQQNLCRLQKLAIGLKTVHLYKNKLLNKDYEILMTQNLLISQCFPHFVEELQRMQVSPKKSRYQKFSIQNRQRQQVLKQSLMYNLAFILDFLFKQNNNLESSSSTLSEILDSDIRTKIERTLADKQRQKEQILDQLSLLLQKLLKLQKEDQI